MKRFPRVLALVLLVGLCFGQTFPTQLAIGFTMRPYLPVVGQNIQFTDTSTGSPVEWLWDFGDGTTSTLQNPTHSYTVPGDYELTFTITDAQGVSMTTTRVPDGR